MRTLLVSIAVSFTIGLLAPAPALLAAPAKKAPPQKAAKTPPKTPQQREADRHFKSGVGLFKQQKYAEALAEFERAYEIAPHPLVLYNIAGCHRQLSHYAEAVAYYRRFLTEGKDVVPADRLAGAQTELDAILALVARVSVTITPSLDGATLSVDGVPIEHPEMPLILPPGEHRLTAKVPGRPETERTVRVASGDDLPLQLVIASPTPTPPPPVQPATEPPEGGPTEVVERAQLVRTPPHRFAIGGGFGTNLLLAKDTGAPSVGLAVPIGSRFEVGLDVVVVAYAVIPSVRVRLAGDARAAVHVIAALPYSFNDGSASEHFVAGAIGLGVRYWPMPSFAFRLESYVAVADKMHGTTIPTFLGGELWF
jgi:hypothetical protein